MSSRIIIGGRTLGSGKYGGNAQCLCGEDVTVLGRCDACHDALRRRRLGLRPNDQAEHKRLAAYLEKFESQLGRCAECGARGEEAHDERCSFGE